MLPEKKLTKAKINLMLDQPFFGRILIETMQIQDDTQPTGYTDGKVIGYNYKFIDGLTLDEATTFSAHETLHIALMHHLRRGNRDSERFNIAADHVINNMLLDAGFKEIKGWYCDPKYRGMSTEAVYDILPVDAKSQGKGLGEVRDLDASPAERAQEEQRVKIAVQQARAAGRLAGSLLREISELLNPQVPWYEELRDIVSENARDDYSWSRPNRRFSGNQVIMPSLYSEKLGKVMVAVDSSGSLSKKDLTKIASEIQGVLDDFPSASCSVIYCDYMVHTEAIEEFDPGDEIVLHPKGGGGTRFEPVFDYIESLEDDPVVLLYMTDLCGNLKNLVEPDYPVIWGTVEGVPADIEVPFGKVCSLCR